MIPLCAWRTFSAAAATASVFAAAAAAASRAFGAGGAALSANSGRCIDRREFDDFT